MTTRTATTKKTETPVEEKQKRTSPAKGTKKELKILPAGIYWYIKYENGGQLPSSLVGIFTDYNQAALRVRQYEESRK